MTALSGTANPTDAIDLDIVQYVARRQALARGAGLPVVPGYSFGMDAKLRQQLASAGPLRMVAHLLAGSSSLFLRQRYELDGLVVGPDQLPDIHAITEQCAQRLGIVTPMVYVQPGGPANAFTLANDDNAPLIVLTAELIDTLDADELRFVIGHECGHIHNAHGVYNTAVEIVANPVARGLVQRIAGLTASVELVRLAAVAVQGGLKLFMLHWSRCAEITCDRAGLICTGNPDAAQRALVKINFGSSTLGAQINLDAYIAQLQNVALPTRLLELGRTHPTTARRLTALQLFAACETLYAWRRDLTPNVALIPQSEVDERCQQALAIVSGT